MACHLCIIRGSAILRRYGEAPETSGSTNTPTRGWLPTMPTNGSLIFCFMLERAPNQQSQSETTAVTFAPLCPLSPRPSTVHLKSSSSKPFIPPHRCKRVFLPRIPLTTVDDGTCPVMYTRCQFPVKPAFAMTSTWPAGRHSTPLAFTTQSLCSVMANSMTRFPDVQILAV
ncbi:hypothetical protein EDD21DRAFT_365044 [Dissophora ornata]|nr:hypothetical protein EDD21DRAFT_365044 [Dissophora ornata]